MANDKQFAIYEYDIIAAKEYSYNLTPEMIQANLEKKQEIFSRLFEGNKLNLYLTTEDGVPKLYENYKWKGIEDVFVYQVNNIKNKKIIKATGKTLNGIPQYNASDVPSLPLGLLAIDNRKNKGGKGLIAIEKNAGWGKTPDKLKELLKKSFNYVLIEYGLEFTIGGKMQPTEFWAFLDEQCNKYGDGVTRVTIDILHKKKKEDKEDSVEKKNTRQRAARLMNNMDDIGEKNGAIKTTLSMEFESVNARKIKDMTHISKLCDDNEYDLSVQLKKFGIYRSNDTVTAFFPMDDDVLNTFGWQYTSTMEDTNHTYKLMSWFDNVWLKVKELEVETETPAPRNKKRKK